MLPVRLIVGEARQCAQRHLACGLRLALGRVEQEHITRAAHIYKGWVCGGEGAGKVGAKALYTAGCKLKLQLLTEAEARDGDLPKAWPSATPRQRWSRSCAA